MGLGYTSDILEDAQAYADHANRPGRIETTDVELTVQARSGWEFTEAAPKDVRHAPFISISFLTNPYLSAGSTSSPLHGS
jgi:hypothetical protein